jgi:hypothetical protein
MTAQAGWPKVAIEWLEFLLRLKEVCALYLAQETGYSY